MYFLIGLGIIVIIVYGNMLYDRIKTKKNKDMTDVEQSAGTADNHFAEQKETKGQKTEIACAEKQLSGNRKVGVCALIPIRAIEIYDIKRCKIIESAFGSKTISYELAPIISA